MSALPNKKFRRLIRLSFIPKNIRKHVKIKNRKKIESNLYVIKKPLAAYYGTPKYNEFRMYNRSPSLLANLETRADVVLYRLHWAKSIFEARDIIRKGYLWVGSQIMTNPLQLIPLHTVFSLFICSRNSAIKTLSLVLANNLQKRFVYRLKKRFHYQKYHQLQTLTRLRARPHQEEFWNQWLTIPSHLFVDHGIQIASILHWPTLPYKHVPYKNLEAFAQHIALKC